MTVDRNICHVFIECSSIGICLMLFSWLDWGYRFLREEDHKAKYHFHHIISRIYIINMTYHCWFDLDNLIEVVFFRFLCCKISLPPPTFAYCTLWKKVQPTMHNPHLRIGELYSTTSLSAKYCVNYLEIFCMGHLSPPFIYWVISVWTH